MRELADAALQRATELGVTHADFRLERIHSQRLMLRDEQLEGSLHDNEIGFAVRVVHDGTWGFAAAPDLTIEAAVRAAEDAVEVARVSRPANIEPVELADEPTHGDVTWISAYDVDPFTVSDKDKEELLQEYSARLLSSDGVDHVDAIVFTVLENKFYADSHGTVTTQQRVRTGPQFTAVSVDRAAGTFDDMRTVAPPAGRGWEYLTGVGWDWNAELAELPDLLAQKVKAPSVDPGEYDLVIDPSNLWLTIHESIGHATELDRALGYEAAYAGTSFATFDRLGSLQYGSPLLNVTGDRTASHALATVGYDDEGVAGQQFDIVRDGVLVGYQLNRHMAQANGLGG